MDRAAFEILISRIGKTAAAPMWLEEYLLAPAAEFPPLDSCGAHDHGHPCASRIGLARAIYPSRMPRPLVQVLTCGPPEDGGYAPDHGNRL